VLAATAAAFAGATVSVIEEQSYEKLSMYGLADIATVNSKWALSRGVPRVDEVEFLAEWQHRTQNRSDPRLIRQFVYHSGEMLDWLLSLMSPEYGEKATIANFPAPNSRFSGEVSGFKSWVGTCELRGWNTGVKEVIAKAEANGARWYWQNRGRVSTQENGRVTGCIAEDKEGKYIKYLANKGVILSTGDFGGNHDMYVALYDEIVGQFESFGLDTSELKASMGRRGDGHLMAVWVGASMEPGPYASIYPAAMGPTHGLDQNLARWGGGFAGTSFMRVNSQGKRYTDEGIMGIYGTLHRSHRTGPGAYYSVFDSQWPEYIQAQCQEHFMMYKSEDRIERTREQMRDLVERGAQGGRVGMMPGRENQGQPNTWGAKTLDELADFIGFKGEVKETFLAEVERYNMMCYQGRDEDFAKDPRLLMPIDKPPYYVTKSVIGYPDAGLVCLNGVITDENQAVLDKGFKPIPGLFATGSTGGGKFFMQYSSLMAGIAVGTAMTFGMLVGRHAASL
jgi:succinate dehydrogenase/fumarate reductase flavoprotein subunit